MITMVDRFDPIPLCFKLSFHHYFLALYLLSSRTLFLSYIHLFGPTVLSAVSRRRPSMKLESQIRKSSFSLAKNSFNKVWKCIMPYLATLFSLQTGYSSLYIHSVLFCCFLICFIPSFRHHGFSFHFKPIYLHYAQFNSTLISKSI